MHVRIFYLFTECIFLFFLPILCWCLHALFFPETLGALICVELDFHELTAINLNLNNCNCYYCVYFVYRWVVFYKNTTIFSRPVEIVYCALIKPEKGPTMSFKNVTINTKYSETQVRQVLPIAIKNDFKVPFFAYQESQTNSSLYLTQKEELISFGIIHVLKDPNSASRIGYLAPSFILVSVLLWISI